ncbi:hypothetical protein, partial [Hymenobacter lapidiphilus]
SLIAEEELVPGRQYEIVRGAAGNVFTRVLGDSGSRLDSLVAWLNPATGAAEPAIYDVVADTVSPLPTGDGGPGGDVTKAYVDAADDALEELISAVKAVTAEWAPGPQKKYAFVVFEGLLYLTLNDLLNGQSSPPGNTANYKPLGESEAVTQAISDLQNNAPYKPSGTTKILWVHGYGQTESGVRGNPHKPFPTIQDAYNAGQDEDIMLIMPGGSGAVENGFPAYGNGGSLLFEKRIRVYCMPGVNINISINAGNFAGNLIDFRFYWKGGNFYQFLVGFRQATTMARYTVEDANFRKGGYVYCFGAGNFGTHSTEFVLRGCRFFTDALGSPGVLVTHRDDMGPNLVYLDSCLIDSKQGPGVLFVGRSDKAGKVFLQGATEIRSATKTQTNVSNPNGSQQTESEWLIDQRPFVGGGGEDPRKDLATESGRRTSNLRREGRCALSNIVLAENAASIAGQLIQAGAAMEAARNGTPAAVAAALNADVAALSDASLYTIRLITTPAVSGNPSAVLLTVLPA